MKVAIVGTAPGSRGLAPYADPEWQIWACSQGNMNALPRIDKWFELHAIGDMTGEENRAWSLPFYGWLRQQSFPVYMQEKNDLVPQAIVFPWKEMIEKFGRNWFTSSVAWMMAFAIHQMGSGDELGLFGVDMAANQEHYTGQRAGCIRMIEFAAAKGIKVHVPNESTLAAPEPLYGYNEATPFGRQCNVRMGTMRRLEAELTAKIEQLTRERDYTRGAIDDLQFIIRTFTDGEHADISGANVVVGEVPGNSGFEQRASGIIVPMAQKG